MSEHAKKNFIKKTIIYKRKKKMNSQNWKLKEMIKFKYKIITIKFY